MKQGILFALIAAVISGCSIFYNRVVVVTGIDPIIFNILKNGGVALVFSCLIAFTTLRNHMRLLSKASWIKLLAIGIIGGGIPFALFFEGLSQIPAVQANLIHKTLFLWVALLAVPLLKERVSKVQILAYAIIFIGTFVIGGMPSFTGKKGELLILAATLLWSVENIIAKKALSHIPAPVTVWARMTFGTIVLFLLAAAQQKTHMLFTLPDVYLLPIAGSVGLLSGYVYFWYKALSKAPATLVTSLLVFAAPVTAFLSSGILHQQMNTAALVSQILLVSAVVLLIYSRLKQHE